MKKKVEKKIKVEKKSFEVKVRIEKKYASVKNFLLSKNCLSFCNYPTSSLKKSATLDDKSWARLTFLAGWLVQWL